MLDEILKFPDARFGLFQPFGVGLNPCLSPFRLLSLLEIGVGFILLLLYPWPLYIPCAGGGLDAKVESVDRGVSQRPQRKNLRAEDVPQTLRVVRPIVNIQQGGTGDYTSRSCFKLAQNLLELGELEVDRRNHHQALLGLGD